MTQDSHSVPKILDFEPSIILTVYLPTLFRCLFQDMNSYWVKQYVHIDESIPINVFPKKKKEKNSPPLSSLSHVYCNHPDFIFWS